MDTYSQFLLILYSCLWQFCLCLSQYYTLLYIEINMLLKIFSTCLFFSFGKIQLKSHLNLLLISVCHSDPSLISNSLNNMTPLTQGKKIPYIWSFGTILYLLYALLTLIYLFIRSFIHLFITECLSIHLSLTT